MFTYGLFRKSDGIISEIMIDDEEVGGGFDELVLVPCHGLYVPGGDFWNVPFDRKHQIPVIEKHIEEGIKYTTKKASRLLLFSGGQTKSEIGPYSEAMSFWYWAMKNIPNIPISQIFLEEFARDSLENVIFSVCRFREIAGKIPKQITIFGFSFKANRFTRLHRLAIGYPENRFTYRTVTENFTNEEMEECVKGEYENAYKHFENDLFGCNSKVLLEKRLVRDPFKRIHGIAGYPHICPEFKQAFTQCTI